MYIAPASTALCEVVVQDLTGLFFSANRMNNGTSKNSPFSHLDSGDHASIRRVSKAAGYGGNMCGMNAVGRR